MVMNGYGLINLPSFDQHYRPMIPPTEGCGVTLRPLGLLGKIAARSLKSLKRQ